MWQQFYTNHKGDNIEILSVAVDAQGPDKPRPYVEKASATYTTVIDQDNLLAQLFSIKAVPNGLLVDEDGVLQYRKYSGFDIRKKEFADLVEEWAKSPSQEWLANRMQEDPTGGPDHEAAIAHFRRGLKLYQAGQVEDALAEWKQGSSLEPDNWNIRKQIWAVEHPEKFYDGEVDYDWQREQIAQGT